ncbi:Serine/threonine-protein phosphatase alpha-1 isoform [Tritrichomonas foetus]|uniref:protein-serine/threonine phosphatase n=1 Tax=Tritrichomonas foetus TaxID=1144522 RepID=A0A1J4K9G4_9EUKA|nr:Serine/threonine-protein phosphatase alpha-1 isoform [Tritrichomonas foetus]|eukprot:OHT07586.1 Serine/threonine-protein phosphatase alpha-1 isoform [Tritrichomonas foetus]
MRKVTRKDVAETLLEQLLFMKGQRPGTKAKLRDIFVKKLVKSTPKLFLQDQIVMEMEPPLIIVGSIFAHFYDLLTIFELNGYPPAHKYLFLGDFIGHGKENIESICLLLCLKVQYPSHIFFIRGYHELSYVNENDGFKAEVLKRYDQELYDDFNKLFNYFPLAAIIGSRILCVNSGISNEIMSIDQVSVTVRPCEINKQSHISHFLSSIPDPNTDGWTDPNATVELKFGLRPLKEFLANNKFQMIIRSHDIVEEGYEFPFDGDESILTLSSIPSYKGKEEKNGCILEMDNTLKIMFKTVRPLAPIYRDYYQKKKKAEPLITIRTRPVY